MVVVSECRFRRARREDLAAIVALLAEDVLGQNRENAAEPLDESYVAAFTAITSDPNQLLAVGELDNEIVATCQVTVVAGLSRRGALRGQIEAVRIRADQRGAGLGETLFQWAIARCRERGCSIVQLTSDKSRKDAHRFYERLGFSASHEGFKLPLEDEAEGKRSL